MSDQTHVIKAIPGFFTVQSLGILRRTPGVSFDFVPMELLKRIDAIDRVIHRGGATSPGPVGDVLRPWYVHAAQVDNLIVLHGKRTVEIYHRGHGIARFDVTADSIHQDGELLFDGPAMLTWHLNVFHRVQSDEKLGSASLNIAVRYGGFDIDTNFSIYDLNLETGGSRVIREGRLDQPSGR
jgi:hypothetical protein